MSNASGLNVYSSVVTSSIVILDHVTLGGSGSAIDILGVDTGRSPALFMLLCTKWRNETQRTHRMTSPQGELLMQDK